MMVAQDMAYLRTVVPGGAYAKDVISPEILSYRTEASTSV